MVENTARAEGWPEPPFKTILDHLALFFVVNIWFQLVVGSIVAFPSMPVFLALVFLAYAVPIALIYGNVKYRLFGIFERGRPGPESIWDYALVFAVCSIVCTSLVEQLLVPDRPSDGAVLLAVSLALLALLAVDARVGFLRGITADLPDSRSLWGYLVAFLVASFAAFFLPAVAFTDHDLARRVGTAALVALAAVAILLDWKR